MCLDAFATTPEMPALDLPCGHAYHAACVQMVADARGPCPLCRAPVADWEHVVAQCGGTLAHGTMR